MILSSLIGLLLTLMMVLVVYLMASDDKQISKRQKKQAKIRRFTDADPNKLSVEDFNEAFALGCPPSTIKRKLYRRRQLFTPPSLLKRVFLWHSRWQFNEDMDQLVYNLGLYDFLGFDFTELCPVVGAQRALTILAAENRKKPIRLQPIDLHL